MSAQNVSEKLSYSPVFMSLLLMRYVPAAFEDGLRMLRQGDPDEVGELVETLKLQADLNWANDPKISLQLADTIIGVGYLREEDRHTALGLMARGDATWMRGNLRHGWQTLRQAGLVFRKAQDRVGWGRTRIGLLMAASAKSRMNYLELQRRTARQIFERNQEVERMIRLDINTTCLYLQRGWYEKALALARRTLDWAEKASEFYPYWACRLYTFIGYIYTEVGDLHQALAYHQRAKEQAISLNSTVDWMLAEINIAYLNWIRARYQEAMTGLETVLRAASQDYESEHRSACRILVKCYLSLNRNQDARELALQITQRSADQASFAVDEIERGYTLNDLAMAEANLGEMEAAYRTLEEADAIFRYADAQNWRFHSRLRHGQIAFLLGDVDVSHEDARTAALYFEQNGEAANSAAAQLLLAQVAIKVSDLPEATRIGQGVLKTATELQLPWLLYSSYLMLAQVAESQSHPDVALEYYDRAAETVEAMQRDLTINLRPDFMQSREDAFHGLVRLWLRERADAQAFAALERYKSQFMLSQIANREQLRWRTDDPVSRQLVTELERLRQDQHAYYQLAYGYASRDGREINPEARARAKTSLKKVEAAMRKLTDQLYGRAGGRERHSISAPTLAAIQARLDPQDVLIAFYGDAHHFYAFVVDSSSIRSVRLPMSPGVHHEYLDRLQDDIEITTSLARQMGMDAPAIASMTTITREKLQELYQGLLAPLGEWLRGRRRLIVAPWGELHYLPFHLLVNEGGYLIEQHEVVIVPAAGLLTAPPVKAAPGALVLADSGGGSIPATQAEAAQVGAIFDGRVYIDGEARLDHLEGEPCQLLHIAAHGKFRLDDPLRSYIQLNGQQISTDDFLQHRLGYELVTLSGCETGRAKTVPGDELVGVGRGFLYAGAGALITSLWRVDDQLTARFMASLCGQLQQGASKAAAIAGAQRMFLVEKPQFHPAFWGAFQLVGSADPLS
jgi:hypothetical protein